MRTFLIFLFLAPRFLFSVEEGKAKAALQGTTEEMVSCVTEGLELRYEFEFQACKRRALWFNDCKGKRALRTSLRYDPITESYMVVRDVLNDDSEPVSSQYQSLEEGLQEVAAPPSVSLLFLSHGDNNFATSPRLYVRSRVVNFCKEDFNETFATITGLLSLGFIDLHYFDSGWERQAP